MLTTFQKIREDYKHATLQTSDVDRDPIVQFGRWFDQAVESGLREPNAMTLATSSSTGEPAARIVLLKGFSESGFTFFTNYDSAKGRQLDDNPRAALVFYWNELERQVRIVGGVKKVPFEVSRAYFNARPLGARIGATVSPQSQVIPDREWLEQRIATAPYDDTNPPECPDTWGGYAVTPESIEFWQGRQSRLHDRLRYTAMADGSGWKIERLAP